MDVGMCGELQAGTRVWDQSLDSPGTVVGLDAQQGKVVVHYADRSGLGEWTVSHAQTQLTVMEAADLSVPVLERLADVLADPRCQWVDASAASTSSPSSALSPSSSSSSASSATGPCPWSDSSAASAAHARLQADVAKLQIWKQDTVPFEAWCALMMNMACSEVWGIVCVSVKSKNYRGFPYQPANA
jgi:hypothetical protein